MKKIKKIFYLMIGSLALNQYYCLADAWRDKPTGPKEKFWETLASAIYYEMILDLFVAIPIVLLISVFNKNSKIKSNMKIVLILLIVLFMLLVAASIGATTMQEKCYQRGI